MDSMQRIEAGLLERYDATITRHRERPVNAYPESVRWWVWDTYGHALDTVEQFLAGTPLIYGVRVSDLVDRIAGKVIARGGVWSGTLEYRLSWPRVLVPRHGTIEVGPLYGDELQEFEETLFQEGISDFAIRWHQEV